MGYQVIQQPGTNLFGIFCSSTDTFVMWEATGEEVVKWFTELAEERARRSVEEAIAAAKKAVDCVSRGDAREVYYQFARTWDAAVALDREHDGEMSADLDGAKS